MLRHLAPVLAVTLAACGPAAKPAPRAPEGPLEAGAAIALLDLPIGHPTAGYAQSVALGESHPPDDPGSPFADIFPATRGMESPPSARVLVLDNGHTRLYLARLDAVFISVELTEKVISMAKDKLGLDLRGHLLLNATHTHDSGCRFTGRGLDASLIDGLPPLERQSWAHGCDTYSPESVRRIAGPLVDAIGEAVKNLRPARFGFGYGDNQTAGHDRRCENDWMTHAGDHVTRVTVLRVDDAKTGDPIAVAFGYGVHGTVYGADNRNLSVDAPGHAEAAVALHFDKPVVAMYLQGSAGDVGPAGGAFHGSQAMQRAGDDLAKTVMDVYAKIQTKSQVALQGLDRRVPLTHDGLGYAPGEFYDDGALLCTVSTASCGATGPGDTKDVYCLGPGLPGKGRYDTYLAGGRIGDLYLLTLPGEPTTLVERALDKAAKDQGVDNLLLLGYAMDHDGYILEKDDWLSGGYETTINLWGWRYADFVVAQSADLLREMRTGKAQDKQVATLQPWTPPPDSTVQPTGSDPVPAVATDVPQTVPRLAEVRFAFYGGDPALGTPDVVLEKQAADGSFAKVLTNGWREVSTRVVDGLPIFYVSSPTYLEAPDATVRSHRYEVAWEPVPSTPGGTYRLHATGLSWDGTETKSYDLVSAPMQVVAETDLEVHAAALTTPSGPELALELGYPAPAATYSTLKGSTGWQISHFPIIDPRFPPPFVPVMSGQATATVSVTASDGTTSTVTPTFDAGDAAPTGPYDPGAGPGFTAALAGPGPWTVDLPAGALEDAVGNTSVAATLTVPLP